MPSLSISRSSCSLGMNCSFIGRAQIMLDSRRANFFFHIKFSKISFCIDGLMRRQASGFRILVFFRLDLLFLAFFSIIVPII